jgi:Ni,Fe-hydrogenase III component G
MKIELLVDERKIQMNDFVQKIIVNVIKAMVETLHTIDSEWKEISIHIEKDELKE